MKKLLIGLLTMISSVILFAHDPDINVIDNKDGTITVKAVYPNGDPTVSSSLYVVSDKPYNGSSDNVINGNLVLFERLIDENGYATVYKPKTKKFYLYLVLAAFPDHEYLLDSDFEALTEDEKSIWLEKMNNDKSLTQDEKDYLLGNKKD